MFFLIFLCIINTCINSFRDILRKNKTIKTEKKEMVIFIIFFFKRKKFFKICKQNKVTHDAKNI